MTSPREEKVEIHPIQRKRVSKELINQFLQLEDLTSTISDVLDSLGICGAIPASILKPAIEDQKVVGPAVTLKNIPENENPSQMMIEGKKSRLKVLNVIPLCQPGDVIVIDGASRFDISGMGELAGSLMKQNGVAGTIADCGIRDLSSLKKLGYPVWSRGVTPITGKLRFDTVEINGPISCAGVPLRPGDLIAADETGVTIIPYERVEEVLKKAIELTKSEEKLFAAIKQKKTLQELNDILPLDKW